MHEVVTGDLRWKPKLREDYKEWAAGQEEIWLAEFMRGGREQGRMCRALRDELSELRTRKIEVMKPFHAGAAALFQSHLSDRDGMMWIVLDPVITVHPDQVLFRMLQPG